MSASRSEGEQGGATEREGHEEGAGAAPESEKATRKGSRARRESEREKRKRAAERAERPTVILFPIFVTSLSVLRSTMLCCSTFSSFPLVAGCTSATGSTGSHPSIPPCEQLITSKHMRKAKDNTHNKIKRAMKSSERQTRINNHRTS
jgi:hypothetical protein